MPQDQNATTAAVRVQIIDLVPALRAFARRFEKNHTDAEDLLQETIVRALDHIEQFQTGTNLKSWLFTIMRNTFCTAYKRRVREPVGKDYDASQYGGSAAASQEWTARAGEVMVALDQLTPRHKAALVQIVLGTSYEEAAELSNCKIGTIKSRVNRARSELLRKLGETESSYGARLQ